MRLVLSDSARGDLKSISRYSAREWGAARKSRYMAAIRGRMVALLTHPELGVAREDLGAGYRTLLIGSHVIFYSIVGKELRVVRVLHQRMDFRRYL